MTKNPIVRAIENHIEDTIESYKIYQNTYHRLHDELRDIMIIDTSTYRPGLRLKHARRIRDLSVKIMTVAQDLKDIDDSINEYRELLNSK